MADKKYDELKRIVTKKYGETILDKQLNKIVKPMVNITDRVKELGKLLGCTDVSDTQTLLDMMIDKVKTVPYIQYPVSFSTVDIVATYYDGSQDWYLLGKKYNQDKWQFPGGFRDPKETGAQAASREFFEETLLKISEFEFVYFDDLYVDDIRYKNSPHKITTTVFKVDIPDHLISLATGGDDLEFVKWFSRNELFDKWEDIVRPVHHGILKMVL